jgi:DNA polymerase III gamma/tau subunit
VKLLIPQEMCPSDVRRALLSVYSSGRIPHALILEGSTGQTLTLAKWLAQAAVCRSEEERPCGHCPGCIKAQAGSHPDILTFGGGEASRSFHKEDIENLRRDAYICPNEAENRVFILENSQNLSAQAQNALLKILEEPPASVQFLLTCDRASSLLSTVRSRSQIYTLEETQQPQDDGLAEKMALAVCSPKESTLLYLTAPLVKDRLKLRAVLEHLLQICRDALILRCGGTEMISGCADTAQTLAQALTRTQLYQITQLVREMHSRTERNANTTLLATDLCAQLRQAAGH